MPQRKNQHYVPQHYLRGWSTDERIEVFHFEHGELPDTSISDVCSVDYLYGNPTHVEDELGTLEGLQNTPLKNLRQGGTLDDLSEAEIILLLSFITTQRTRSKFTQEDIAEGDEFLRQGVRDDFANDRYQDIVEWTSDLTEQEKENTLVEASILSIHHQHILFGIFGYHAIKDLQGVMLRNVSDRDFVISDNPVVFDNPRFKRQTGMGGAGIAERGLQIFCPIDPTRLLLLYDPAVYSFEYNSRRQVVIKDLSVVNELNLLQFHNAESIIMHEDCDATYLHELADRMDEARVRKTLSQEYDVQDMETFEVETTPPHQVPGISPAIPGQTTFHKTSYTQSRSSSQETRTQELVRDILEEVGGYGDAGIVFAIRHLEASLRS